MKDRPGDHDFQCFKGCSPKEPCYHCQHCGGYGDECGCGPAVFGCNGSRYCPVTWHVHGCSRDQGDCDQPQEHLVWYGPTSAYWPTQTGDW